MKDSPEIPSPENQTHGGRPPIDVEKQALVTLWYLANKCTIRDIADRFGITESCVHSIIRRVCSALSEEDKNIIIWPIGERMHEVIGEFHELKGLPGIIGLIDGCHIPIPKPKNDPESYMNRKKFSSIILQGICDHELLFTNINVGYPGSVHDGRVLRNSLIYQASLDPIRKNEIFPNGSYLLGDAA